MRVCLGQINTTPGDFEGNLGAMLKGMRAAVYGGSTLIAFPELSIPGYLSQDLLYQPRYICLLYTSPSPRDQRGARMPSSA